MSKQTIITKETLVPLGVLVTSITVAVGIARAIGSQDVQVNNLSEKVNRLESRQDKADERWTAVREDLASIKAKLGIADAGKK